MRRYLFSIIEGPCRDTDEHARLRLPPRAARGCFPGGSGHFGPRVLGPHRVTQFAYITLRLQQAAAGFCINIVTALPTVQV